VTGTHVHLDLLGTGAFIPATLLPLLALKKPLPASIITSQITITLWAGRLAMFLFYRATILRHDGRLTDTLSTISGSFGFWFVSFIWGVFSTLPHTLSLSPIAKAKAAGSTPPPLVALGAVGFVVSIAGLVIEILADLQKWNFKNTNPAGTFIQSGLWGISQHPNYCGNLLIFSGLVLQNLGTLSKGGFSCVAGSLLSPVFIFALFYGQATGMVANAVDAGVAKYGKSYVEYMVKTPLIFPAIGKWFKGW